MKWEDFTHQRRERQEKARERREKEKLKQKDQAIKNEQKDTDSKGDDNKPDSAVKNENEINSTDETKMDTDETKASSTADEDNIQKSSELKEGEAKEFSQSKLEESSDSKAEEAKELTESNMVDKKEPSESKEDENKQSLESKGDEIKESIENEHSESHNDEKKDDDESGKSEKLCADPLLTPILTHIFRTGWSVEKTSLQLGEDEFSYGYESTGKFVSKREFNDFSGPYKLGDVVGAYLVSLFVDNMNRTFYAVFRHSSLSSHNSSGSSLSLNSIPFLQLVLGLPFLFLPLVHSNTCFGI